MSDPIRVLVADDHHLVRSGLRAMLDVHDDLDVVGEAEDGQAALAAVAELEPDVVVMDIRMPRLDGIEATRRLRSREVAPQVLVLTTFDLDEYVYEALVAGAGGFLLKDAPPSQLAEAVRTVAAGEALLAPAVTRRLLAGFVASRTAASGPPAASPALSTLTARERDTFTLLARGMSNAEIARELVVSEHTVKTHVGNVLMKLGLRDRVQAVIHAYEHGVVRPGEPA